MIILGIDPGTTIIGFGVIEKDKSKLKLIDYGVIRTKKSDQSEKLLEINKELVKLIKKHKPAIAGLETLFFSTNKKTALAVAEARGSIMLTLRQNSIPVKEFTPNNIKSTVSGYGKSDKKAMEKIVSLNLGIKDSSLPDDAFDALAIAIRTSFENPKSQAPNNK